MKTLVLRKRAANSAPSPPWPEKWSGAAVPSPSSSEQKVNGWADAKRGRADGEAYGPAAVGAAHVKKCRASAFPLPEIPQAIVLSPLWRFTHRVAAIGQRGNEAVPHKCPPTTQTLVDKPVPEHFRPGVPYVTN